MRKLRGVFFGAALYICTLMEEMEDLGAKFGRERTFSFDQLIIQEIIFDESNDVTLFGIVPYFGKMYAANFGLTFDQLNTLLRSSRSAGTNVATALAEKLDVEEIEVPSVLNIEELFGEPLEIKNCILHTTLFEVQAELEEGEAGEDAEGGTYEAYAFLVDDLEVVKEK